MKTAIYCPIYLDGNDYYGNSRYERVCRWLNFHYTEPVSADVWLCDNGSDDKLFYSLLKEFEHLELNHIRLPHLTGGNGNGIDYPYCWRAIWEMRKLIDMGYEKIVFIDNDCYVLREHMIKCIADIKQGWNAFFIPKYNFPSAELQVLCKDAFPLFLEYTSGGWGHKTGLTIEKDLPFTRIHMKPKGDRYGETKEPQRDDMDFYCQAQLDVPLVYKP